MRLIVLTRQLSGDLWAGGGVERVVQRLFFPRRNIRLTREEISQAFSRRFLRIEKVGPLNTHDRFRTAISY